MNRCDSAIRIMKNMCPLRYGSFGRSFDSTKHINEIRTFTTRISLRPHNYNCMYAPQWPYRHHSVSSAKKNTFTTVSADPPIVTVTKTTTPGVSLNTNEPSTTTTTTSPPPQPHPLLGTERANAIKTLNEASHGSPFQWEDVSRREVAIFFWMYDENLYLLMIFFHSFVSNEQDPSGRNAIVKVYYFMDFVQAFDFMKHIAVIAEEMNHHPEWKNIYNIVDVTLSTHDCHGVSHLDIQLAQHMDTYANSLLPKRGSSNTTAGHNTSTEQSVQK